MDLAAQSRALPGPFVEDKAWGMPLHTKAVPGASAAQDLQLLEQKGATYVNCCWGRCGNWILDLCDIGVSQLTRRWQELFFFGGGVLCVGEICGCILCER